MCQDGVQKVVPFWVLNLRPEKVKADCRPSLFPALNSGPKTAPFSRPLLVHGISQAHMVLRMDTHVTVALQSRIKNRARARIWKAC